MISAGRVLIKPRGEWNAETTYHMLDLVNHKGYAWLSKRTVIGIEPSNDAKDYWHNMLDIEKVVAEAMAGTLAEEVSELLKDELSESRYVTDLLTEYDVPTFVYWNDETENTPYTEGLTTITHGYSLVEGSSLTAWADGETFTYGANGWDKVITSSGGIMSGPLGLGDGKGTVSADKDGAFLEAKNGDDFKQIKVKNDSLEESAKLVTKDKEFNLFGEHNPNKMVEMGFAKIQFGTYVGTGESGKNNPNRLTFDFEPKVIFFSAADGVAFNGNTRFEESFVSQTTNTITWSGNAVSWYYSGTNENTHQMNVKDKVYGYVAIG